ncbi:Hormone-sensitive lipase [Aphelenchoides besseyi]|nr:Hormone-sensitive lipase [Aphelenchoides besseyi]
MLQRNRRDKRNDQRLDAEDARGCTKMRLRRTHTGKWISVVLWTETLDENSLFPSLHCDYSSYRGMLKGIESLDASCFYGRTFGFQFVPSVASIFNAIGIILATYSLSWESGTAAFSSLDKITKLQANKWITLSYKIPKIYSNRSLQIFFDLC